MWSQLRPQPGEESGSGHQGHLPTEPSNQTHSWRQLVPDRHTSDAGAQEIWYGKKNNRKVTENFSHRTVHNKEPKPVSFLSLSVSQSHMSQSPASVICRCESEAWTWSFISALIHGFTYTLFITVLKWIQTEIKYFYATMILLFFCLFFLNLSTGFKQLPQNTNTFLHTSGCALYKPDVHEGRIEAWHMYIICKWGKSGRELVSKQLKLI